MPGEHVVLEGNDPRDGVDALSLQLRDEHVQIPDPDGAERPRRPRQWHSRLVRDEAAVALDVDHHRVKLGPLDEIEHALADDSVADTVIAQVECLPSRRRVRRHRAREEGEEEPEQGDTTAAGRVLGHGGMPHDRSSSRATS
jgi:hypothetical protein